MFLKALTILAAVGSTVLAQRPSNTTICDYYTPTLLKVENSPESQQKLMALIVHTFILGNYTTPNTGVKVQGIAAPYNYEGHEVNLLPYFTGGYASTSVGGKAVAKNFLDDGGATTLLQTKPSDTTTSNQYALLTHIYQYFATFFGCSQQGGDGFPSYQGRASQYTVHEFMDLDLYEMNFFIGQVGLSMKSLGFEEADITFTKTSLDKVFNRRCSPAATVIPESVGPELQTICIAENCLLDPNATCAAYPNKGVALIPAVANVTLLGNVTKADSLGNGSESSYPSGSGSGSTTASASATGATSTGDAARLVGASTVLGSIAAVVGAGLFAFTM